MNDYSKLTDKELIIKLKELENIRDEYDAIQMSIKIVINSMYGVFTNNFFAFFSYAIGETITGQGRNVILTTRKNIIKYFKQLWGLDKQLHKKMNIDVIKENEGDIVVYGDTDSMYYQFGTLMKTIKQLPDRYTDVTHGITNFVLDVYNYRLKDYYKKLFDGYSDKYKVSNLLNFEMEKVVRKGVFLTKKKYVLDMAWDNKAKGTYYGILEYFDGVGGDLISRKIPKYFRSRLKETIIYMFKNNNHMDMRKFMKLLKEEKKVFKLKDIDMISSTMSINNYNNYVIDDYDSIKFRPKTPPQLKASAYYNYKLNNNPQYKRKYPMIKDGDRVKLYKSNLGIVGIDMFAYLPNTFPYEIAPTVDYDSQFRTYFIRPLNKYLKSMGMQEMSDNFMFESSLF